MNQVIVKTSKFKNLTRGKSYVIDSIFEDTDYYLITNDAGVTSRYHKSNFETSSKSEGDIGDKVKKVAEIDKFINLLNVENYNHLSKYFNSEYDENNSRITITIKIEKFKFDDNITLTYNQSFISCGIYDVYGLNHILGFINKFKSLTGLTHEQSTRLLIVIFRVIFETFNEYIPCAFINFSTSLSNDDYDNEIYLDILNYLSDTSITEYQHLAEGSNANLVINKSWLDMFFLRYITLIPISEYLNIYHFKNEKEKLTNFSLNITRKYLKGRNDIHSLISNLDAKRFYIFNKKNFLINLL